jgi:hypothetical protein
MMSLLQPLIDLRAIVVGLVLDLVIRHEATMPPAATG